MAFSVRVVDEDGNGKGSVEVSAHFGILGGSLDEYTDSDGWAYFEPAGDHATVDLHVDGTKMGTYRLSEGKTFSFTV